ncbi:hypothetical protein AB0J21_23680 [Streptomyces sp. NPDC049954]|uniref:hypothetical protein n=1 Tax=Streptomyces sp. NPDC049954 TaxID=3155779 RepID=UPI003414CD0F
MPETFLTEGHALGTAAVGSAVPSPRPHPTAPRPPYAPVGGLAARPSRGSSPCPETVEIQSPCAPAPGACDPDPAVPVATPSAAVPAAPAAVPAAPGRTPGAPLTGQEKGCLFALSQPPLMIFLTVVGLLLLMGAVHDLFIA